MIDLSHVADVLLSLASAAVLAAIPILVPAIMKRLGVANDADLVNKVTTAAEAGAGLAYKFAVSREGGLAKINVHDDALAAGVKYVTDRLPDTLTSLGLSPDNVKAMVEARLGELLASDPSVSAGKPAQAVDVSVKASGTPPIPIHVSAAGASA